MAVIHDERVETAIRNWAPRFLTNGVYYSDFVSTTERIQAWDQWCAEWSRSARVHEEIAEAAEAAGSRITARDAYREAALCYHYAKFLFVNDMAQLREAHN
ncbi:MAG: alpha/beta hydrolase, partial [Dehalococcoidia bacterium]